MQTKLQELTEKIYNEGVQKAREEAESILKAAHQKAIDIENDARKNAENIEADARRQSETLKSHVASEIRMTLNQSMAALRQEVGALITLKAIEPPVKEVFGDMDYLKGLMEMVVKGWMQKEDINLEVVLPEQNRAEMLTFFKNQMAMEMNKGLAITFSDGFKSGFKIGPADKSYVIGFTEEDFMNFFKTYLRPKSTELLFDKTK